MTACADDTSARATFDAVRAELVVEDTLVWQPWETIVSHIAGHDNWRDLFVERYLDFTLVEPRLAPGDPRRRARPPHRAGGTG